MAVLESEGNLTTCDYRVDFRCSVRTLLVEVSTARLELSKRSCFGKSRGIKLAFVFNLTQRRGGRVENQRAICDQARLV